jgi:hypothetical protein
MNIQFALTYTGSNSDENEIDFYDVSQALIGFQRTIALTTHLILNNEVIVQAPSLRGAKIFAEPAAQGSWKFLATVSLLGTASYNILTADRNTVLGNLVTSAYDYVISESLGFDVDFNKTLIQQYKELHQNDKSPKVLKTSAVEPMMRLDSLVEKCEAAIAQIHRPIVESETAKSATVIAKFNSIERKLGPSLNQETFDYLDVTTKSPIAERFVGKVSSYNVNTFKGRIYVVDMGRPIPFIISDEIRNPSIAAKVAANLAINAETSFKNDQFLVMIGHRLTSKSGRLKAILTIGLETV